MVLRVDELLDLLDLQGSIRIGGDRCDDHRFVGRVRPGRGLCLDGKLHGGIMFSRCDLNLGVRDTDVNDDLPHTFNR